MKKRSIIGSTLKAAGRFTRGVVAVGTVGVSELVGAGVKKVGSIFKEKKSNDDEFDFEDFEEDFEDELEEAIEDMDTLILDNLTDSDYENFKEYKDEMEDFTFSSIFQ